MKNLICFITSSWISLIVGTLTLAPQVAQAKIFRNAYISFELPPHWNCNMDQTEWICKSNEANMGKRGVIAITAKETGPADNFSLYEDYLNKSLISAAPKQGPGAPSKIIYKSKNTKIQDQPWLDALHIGSEFPGYYTRYLATIRGKLSILITFTAHKDNYARFNQEFFQTIASLRIIASNDFLTKPQGVGVSSGNIFGNVTQGLINGGQLDLPEPGEFGKQSKRKKLLLLGGFLLATLFGFFLLRKKKKKSPF